MREAPKSRLARAPTGYEWSVIAALSYVWCIGSVAVAADWWGRVYRR